ncbi:MAG TPA: hypothetical protein VNO14_07260 [Blastocatellia bacterium]|nr:hypothetical protein [Blastocatellia bacterium]
MKSRRMILLIAVLVAVVSHRSDGQPSRPLAEQLRLAGVMPRGGLVYVQARDLSALMKMWMASGARASFYKSPSHTAFSRSRVYLKFQDRKKDFEAAIGVGLDEGRLAELAGAASAVTIYDIGNLEMVFVTEVGRERAIATALFKKAPQFQERSAQNTPYYVREVTTDGGRLNQQFCFAYAGGRLIVTTTEGLMIRALGNVRSAGEDSMLQDVLSTAERARGFTSHEVTMWLDQGRLNRNRYFNNYWVHRNAESTLAGIENGLIDLRITPEGLSEQRWFVLGGASAGPSSISGERASAMLRLAPADAHLVEIHSEQGATPRLSAAVSEALFGRLPPETAISNRPVDHSSSDDDGGFRAERYSRLDMRFDIDVDDEQAPIRRTGSAPKSAASEAAPAAGFDFDQSFISALSAASPSGYSQVARSKKEAGKPLVRFERAVIVELGAGAGLDRAALERAIIEEMRSRFVVAGVETQLAWQDEASVRYVARSLLEQGAAYSISGRYLVLASSKEMVSDILRASATRAAPTRIDEAVEYYAVVRISDAKPVYDSLMSKLDGGTGQQADDDEEVKFFSENLSSLIAATSIRDMRVSRARSDSMMIERVVYSY